MTAIRHTSCSASTDYVDLPILCMGHYRSIFTYLLLQNSEDLNHSVKQNVIRIHGKM